MKTLGAETFLKYIKNISPILLHCIKNYETLKNVVGPSKFYF